VTPSIGHIQRCRQLVPKVCGADVELGNSYLSSHTAGETGYLASKLLLREIPGIFSNSESYDPQDRGRRFLASNGGCIYIDLDHLEICIPEVTDAFQYVAAFHAMLMLARQAMAAANARCPAGERIQVLANNSDGFCNSYGGHLNFLLSRATWNDIFHRKPHYLAFLVAFQVSSIVVTGQGKVGAENGADPVDYQLSQRADFLETVTGLQTTHNRPIVNSRDESLCTDGELARLHCIFYDTNLCHVANLLKCGGMQIVLALLEAGRANPALILNDPLDAVRRYSHDPTLTARARTASGRRLTAVELQLQFVEEARRFVDTQYLDGVVPRAGEILDLYQNTLEKLQAGEFDTLAKRLDWVLKKALIEKGISDKACTGWASPGAKHLDHLYSSLDPGEGLYWLCEGGVEKVTDRAEIERFMCSPPDDTRAYTRAMLLRLAGAKFAAHVDWDSMTFRIPSRSGWYTTRRLDLPDPLSHTKQAHGATFEHGRSLAEILDVLCGDELTEPAETRLVELHPENTSKLAATSSENGDDDHEISRTTG